ncbi:MAG: STAS domain-containing protein [Planctomycetota bacterium]|jgi:anti-anti-sigma regulatory factor
MPRTEDATIERLFPLLLGGDCAAALELLGERRRDGATADQLRAEVIAPLWSMLHRLHRSGQVTPVAYTGAQSLLDRLSGDLRESGAAGLAAAASPARSESGFVQCRFNRGVLALRLAGPSIGEREARIARDDILERLRRHGREIRTLVLDFTEIRMMSSIGLNLCIDVRNTAQGLGARTIAYGLRRELRKLFSLTRVDRLYEMPRTREELRRALAV